MALPWLASVVVTAVGIALVERRSLRSRRDPVAGDPMATVPTVPTAPALTVGLGVVGVAAVTVLVLILHSPALPVAAVGAVVATVRLSTGRMRPAEVRRVVGAPVLVGLFGIAVALGTLGRTWSGPATLLSHLDAVGTAAVAAVSTVLVNNLPAAALLASRVPPHPYALLVGLDIGPNLFVTGSLAWILWIRTCRSSGAAPPVARSVGIGLVTVPLAVAAALAMLAATGSL
jgi:arsenical pump membrane protein